MERPRAFVHDMLACLIFLITFLQFCLHNEQDHNTIMALVKNPVATFSNAENPFLIC